MQRGEEAGVNIRQRGRDRRGLRRTGEEEEEGGRETRGHVENHALFTTFTTESEQCESVRNPTMSTSTEPHYGCLQRCKTRTISGEILIY